MESQERRHQNTRTNQIHTHKCRHLILVVLFRNPWTGLLSMQFLGLHHWTSMAEKDGCSFINILCRWKVLHEYWSLRLRIKLGKRDCSTLTLTLMNFVGSPGHMHPTRLNDLMHISYVACMYAKIYSEDQRTVLADDWRKIKFLTGKKWLSESFEWLTCV